MKEKYDEFMQSVGKWKKTDPERVEAFFNLMDSVENNGVLDKKTKELIAIALSVGAQCEYCIAFHVKRAVDMGITPEEMREAGWMAVLMGGGPKLTTMTSLEKAIEEFTS